MFAKLIRYCMALIVVFGSAVGYELTVVPMLEPPPLEAIEIEPAAIMTRASFIDELFPEGSWQRKAPRRLKTDAGFMLFSHREQIATDRWRVWPVTVVVGDGDSPPVVMEAPQGAEIKFVEPLDVLSRGAPPIESGQLRGKVSIRTMSRSGGKPVPISEQLEISATDVGIDRRRIWTHENIRLRWGETVLAGRNLTLQLAGGGGIPTDGDASPLSILDSMQLVYLDELSIPIGSGGLLGKKDEDSRPTANAEGEGRRSTALRDLDETADSRVTVQCEGTVSFDFATDTLELRNQVRLEHVVAGESADTVECHGLRIKFNNALATDIPRETPSDWLRKIEATGEPVLAKLPSLNAEAAAERVSYDAEEMRFRMHGPGGVRISYRGMNLKTTEFDYTIPMASPEKIGTLKSDGSGIISFQDPARATLRRLRWNKGLRLTAVDASGEHELLVDGEVEATMVDGGTVQAETLAFRFRQDAPAESAANGDEPSSFGVLTPTTAQATGKVKLDTAALFTETEELQLFFDVQRQPKADQEDQLSLNPAEGEPLRFWVKPPEASADDGAPGDAPVAGPIPKLFGDKVRAKVTVVDQQFVGGDLSVEGNVRLEHEMITEQGALPVAVSGQQLRVINIDGEERVHIVGGDEPARFDLGDGFFVGPVIEINLRDNYVWIKDGGSFRMPSAVLPSGDQQAAVRWAAPPQCDWSGEMLFDGREIELSGGVRLTAEMRVGADMVPWKMAASGDRLKLNLDQEIRIGQPEHAKSAAVRDMALLGNDERPVYLTADEVDQEGHLVTRHVLSAPVLSVFPGSGGLVGEGPGWYRQWTVSAGKGAMAKFSPAGTLIATHLVYEEEMVAHLQNRRLDFVRGVRIGVSPVERWEELIEVDQMESLTEGQAAIACDRLSFVQAPEAARSSEMIESDVEAEPGRWGGLGAWEMLAEGGVVFRARNDRGLLEGTASRASYAAVKDLFVVEGDGRRAARFQQTYPTGLPGPKFDLTYLAVRPRTMEVVDLVLQGASIGTLPNQRQPR